MVNTEIRLIKRLLLIKENQISQVKEFSTFLCMGGCKKESGLTEIILIIFFAAEDGEALYSQQKQDLELTVAQIKNSLLQNSHLN